MAYGVKTRARFLVRAYGQHRVKRVMIRDSERTNDFFSESWNIT